MMSQFPQSQPLKKAEGKILIRTFRLDRPNLLMLLPSGPIYKCKIAYVPLLSTRSRSSFVCKSGLLLVCVLAAATNLHIFINNERKNIGIKFELHRQERKYLSYLYVLSFT